ncbi:MAG: hypothetical protein IJI96_02800 [Methanobrevibacter sp.]|nr:hypothetical protein [Methanobrevibacter sp.]MBQ6627436.1 hypothetical protein [Methanobrevibacter sp.]
MNNVETKIFLETRLRNLKRKQSKLSSHAELVDEYFEVGKEIEDVKAQIMKLQ